MEVNLKIKCGKCLAEHKRVVSTKSCASVEVKCGCGNVITRTVRVGKEKKKSNFPLMGLGENGEV